MRKGKAQRRALNLMIEKEGKERERAQRELIRTTFTFLIPLLFSSIISFFTFPSSLLLSLSCSLSLSPVALFSFSTFFCFSILKRRLFVFVTNHLMLSDVCNVSLYDMQSLSIV